MANGISRREVMIGAAAAAVAASTVTKSEAATPTPQDEGHAHQEAKPGRLKLGIIGCGGKGWSGMQGAAEFGDVIAVADVDQEYRNRAIQEHPRASAFNDYREMLQAMKGKIDSVVISTPDHHHYYASLLAMRMGLHCYTEKPLTHCIWEARQLARLAREKKVATQMGNQSTASTAMRKTAALIRSGAFGKVKEVHLWTDRAGGWWKQGIDRPTKADAPKKLDFEAWLGPAPVRDFGNGYHPFHWRGWWDFGTGSLGDMGCHIFNMPFMALGLRDPIAIQAETSGHNHDSFPAWSIVHYEFGERKGRAPLDLWWHDGGKRPAASLAPGFEFGGNGVIVVCEKATIYSPDEGNTTFHLVGGGTMPDVQVDESPGHMAEWARACFGGPPAVSNFPDYSGPLTETVLLGNLAIWANGPRLEWDAKRMTVKGNNAYDRLIKMPYRKGWS